MLTRVLLSNGKAPKVPSKWSVSRPIAAVLRVTCTLHFLVFSPVSPVGNNPRHLLLSCGAERMASDALALAVLGFFGASSVRPALVAAQTTIGSITSTTSMPTSVSYHHQNTTSDPKTSTETVHSDCGPLMTSTCLTENCTSASECVPTGAFYAAVIVPSVAILLVAVIVSGVCFHKRRQQSQRELQDIAAKESGTQPVGRKKNDYTRSRTAVAVQIDPEHPDYTLVPENPETAEVIYANETPIHENTDLGGGDRGWSASSHATAAHGGEPQPDFASDDAELQDLPIAPLPPSLASGGSEAVGKAKASRARPTAGGSAASGSQSSSGRAGAGRGRRPKQRQAELEPTPEEPIYANAPPEEPLYANFSGAQRKLP